MSHGYAFRLLVLFIRLLEKEVCRQLLVLIACKVSLDDLVARETKSAETLDGVAFFLGHANGSCARWKRTSITHSANSVASSLLC